ncbi:MAG: lysine exporter LysO family protein [Prevotellaceae bacterium]|jgi:uncharacterized membrane protein YbjE (DUF340 family)|nr:lysine exporter LysO family protein [Prevotellaceae bacterium]
MIEVILFLVLGILLGYFVRKKQRFLSISNRLVSISIYALLFLLGVALGTNSDLLRQLPKLGGYAFVLAVLSILGSIVLAAFLYRKMFKKTEEKHEE